MIREKARNSDFESQHSDITSDIIISCSLLLNPHISTDVLDILPSTLCTLYVLAHVVILKIALCSCYHAAYPQCLCS